MLAEASSEPLEPVEAEFLALKGLLSSALDVEASQVVDLDVEVEVEVLVAEELRSCPFAHWSE